MHPTNLLYLLQVTYFRIPYFRIITILPLVRIFAQIILHLHQNKMGIKLNLPFHGTLKSYPRVLCEYLVFHK